MTDLYLQENSSVLKNLLGITDEKKLDLAEYETDFNNSDEKSEKYSKYDNSNYEPTKHEYIK